ncbi:MAG: tetratricopeptide repeat protein [Bradyrhizobium sp.]|uniref:tetratricopeptide repeat protein n=1 Tax=Bradyrhizobium sp. TaxID=376 RepID=UPI00353DF08E
MRRPSIARLLSSAAVAAMLAAGLGGCKTMGDITGSLASKSDPAAETDPRRAAEVYGERYRANPKDADAALRYGTALRGTGQRAQAVAVLERASMAHPGNKQLLAAYGRALAENGNFQLSFDVLSRAHSPDSPDWRILSVQGTALDQMGKHQEARGYYESALRIAPGEPSVLSNLGLSYVLSRDLPRAEETLRKAQATGRADARVRQNLALAVGLQGRFTEAESIARADLPPDEAAANVAYLKQMLARKDHPRTAMRGRPPVVAQDQSD